MLVDISVMKLFLGPNVAVMELVLSLTLNLRLIERIWRHRKLLLPTVEFSWKNSKSQKAQAEGSAGVIE